MSNEAHRIGIRTGGNANIVSVLGDLISSDGIQALRVPLGTPGQFLGVDLTAECGLAWSSPGGGGSLTFSDGVTRSADNVTNDLVTGTPVDSVNAIVTFANSNSQLFFDTDASVSLSAGNDGGGDGALFLNGGAVALQGSSSAVVSGGAGNATLTSDTNNRVRVLGAGGIEIVATNPGNDFNVTVADGLNLTSSGGQILIHATGEIVEMQGTTFNLEATATTGQIATGTDVNIIVGEAAGTGQVNVMPTNTPPAATLTFRIWDGAGDSQMAYIQASGGAVVDVEARVALNALLNQMSDWGWLAPAT